MEHGLIRDTAESIKNCFKPVSMDELRISDTSEKQKNRFRPVLNYFISKIELQQQSFQRQQQP